MKNRLELEPVTFYPNFSAMPLLADSQDVAIVLRFILPEHRRDAERFLFPGTSILQLASDNIRDPPRPRFAFLAGGDDEARRRHETHIQDRTG